MILHFHKIKKCLLNILRLCTSKTLLASHSMAIVTLFWSIKNMLKSAMKNIKQIGLKTSGFFRKSLFIKFRK